MRLLLVEQPGSPYVFGWLRPIIVLPASVLAALLPWQVEAILAHELAHVRRHDFLVSLLQSTAEVLLFYHPAVWWISRQIRTEREHCCDDRAVAVCGSVTSYAQALLAMEEFRQSTVPLALTASGGSLLNRIRRLVALESSRPQGSIHASSRSTLALMGLVLTSALLVACADLVTSESLDTPLLSTEEPYRPPLTVTPYFVTMDDVVIIESKETTSETRPPLTAKPFIIIHHPEWGFVVSAAPFEKAREAGTFRGGTLTFTIAGKTTRLESHTDIVGPNATPAYVRVAYTPDDSDAIRSTRPYISISDHGRVLTQADFSRAYASLNLKRSIAVIDSVPVYLDFHMIESRFVLVASAALQGKTLTFEDKVEMAKNISGHADDIAIVTGIGNLLPNVEKLPEEYHTGDFFDLVKLEPGDFVIVKLLD